MYELNRMIETFVTSMVAISTEIDPVFCRRKKTLSVRDDHFFAAAFYAADARSVWGFFLVNRSVVHLFAHVFLHTRAHTRFNHMNFCM